MDSVTVVPIAVGAMLIGSWAGRGPQNVARELGRPGMGMIAMLICMLVGFMCGGIFAFPVAWLLSTYIKQRGPVVGQGYAGAGGDDFQRALQPAFDVKVSPYTAIGPVIVCNRCRHSGSRGKDGNPPQECPSCRHPFTSTAGALKQRPTKSRRRDREDEELVVLRPAYPDRR